jgi:hypothetical protein
MSQELNFHCSYSDRNLLIFIPHDKDFHSENLLNRILKKHVQIPSIDTIDELGDVYMFKKVDDYNTAKFICKSFRIQVDYKIPN